MVIRDQNVRRSQGEMLWFNNDKDFGFIASVSGERLYVSGDGFRGDGKPEGRCAGLAVTFRLTGDADSARAEDVAFVEDLAPRRARIRRGFSR
jgi:cold shock CspA family protein